MHFYFYAYFLTTTLIEFIFLAFFMSTLVEYFVHLFSIFKSAY